MYAVYKKSADSSEQGKVALQWWSGRGDDHKHIIPQSTLYSYNDTYGFRQGDRVILLFAELLKAHTLTRDRFVGHVGGDDFFMGIKGQSLDAVVAEIHTIGRRFQTNVESFYPKEAVERGCIEAKDRDGREQRFPLMTVSSAVLELPAQMHRIYSPEEIGELIAEMKKAAKQSPDKLSAASLNHFDGDPAAHDRLCLVKAG